MFEEFNSTRKWAKARFASEAIVNGGKREEVEYQRERSQLAVGIGVATLCRSRLHSARKLLLALYANA